MALFNTPIGFGLTLAKDPTAVAAYASLTAQQKQTVLDRARNARSRQELQQLVASIAEGSMEDG